jgi:hypothetical protein
MQDIDTLLSRLKDMPLDPRLGAIDDAILDGLARRARSQVSLRAAAMVALLSLGIGLGGSVVPSQPVRAATIFPLGAPAALAPSTLLDSGK